MGAHRRVPARTATLLLAFAVLMCGCSTITGKPVPTGEVITRAVRPSFVYGTDGSRIDTLAATVVTDVQAYWAQAYPKHFPGRWHDLDGGFFSVDTTDTSAEPPPCVAEVSDLAGNAFYCATVDAIAWDRAALLPVLREHYGEAAVVVVLAHEMGHAVQHRVAIASDEAGQAEPPALTEAVADCYAGAYMGWVTGGHSDHLRIGEDQLDGAMRALIGFRDPLGASSSDADAHGTAFDRVSAFQDGYRSGPSLCAGMTMRGQGTADRSPNPDPDPRNQPARKVVRTRSAAMRTYFSDLVARRGGSWDAPDIRRTPSARCAGNADAAITYCGAAPALIIDHPKLARLNYEIGDHATATVLASRYALAALSDFAPEVSGPTAHRRAVCLTGAYTSSLPLAAGDLGEAVTVLLAGAGHGAHRLSGFDRVAAFRAGMSGGPRACGP